MTGSLEIAAPRLAREQGGWTLIELLVGMLVSLLVIGAAVTMLIYAVRAEPVSRERAGQIQEGRTMIERVSRELRQGRSVSGTGASTLSVITYVNSNPCGGAASSSSILCRVTYACSAGICTRTERNPDGSGTAPAAEVIRGLYSSSVFSYQPSAIDPTYIGIELSFPADGGGEAVTLEDGVFLRNHRGPTA